EGVFLCAQAAISDLKADGAGRLINIASTAGLKGYPYVSAYVASKHAVVGLTRALALEYARKDVTVNAICPGFTDTAIVEASVENIIDKTGRSREEAIASLVSSNPQGRLISVDEVAQTVLWLCQDSARSITGQAIAVAGGEVM
ncbi:MAG: SDR family oxidoreductase, partial [Pseudomonadota bacterium]